MFLSFQNWVISEFLYYFYDLRLKKNIRQQIIAEIPKNPPKMLEYCSIVAAMLSHFSPNSLPINIKIEFQINVPQVVYNKNFEIGIFAIPAGTEIKLLMSGTNRQRNTAFPPLFLNHFSALSISFILRCRIFPTFPETIFSRRSLFKIFPT